MSSALSIDPANLASQYTQIERQAKDQILSTQYKKYNNQIKAFTDLKTNLSNFFDALDDYQNPENGLLSNTAAVSNDAAMSITTSADAVSGDYDIFVEQTAQAHQIALSFDPTQPLATDGEFGVSLGADSFSVDLTSLAAGATLNDFASAINNHVDNTGVKATVMRSGTETFLVLTSDETGAANTVATTFTPGTDANGANITNAIATQQELTSAQDAIVKLGANSNITVTSASNQLDDVIDGVTINLTQAQQAGDTPIHVSIAQDNKESVENIQQFIDKFNTLLSSITGNDALKRDVMASGIGRSLRNDFQGEFAGQTLFSVGIEFDRYGKLSVDTTKLEDAIANQPEQLTQMLTGPDGLMAKLEQRVEPYTKSYGLINDKKNTLQASLNLVVDKQQRHEYSMEQVYNRYLSQFTQMQITISKLESSMGQF
ncbi:flagellar filament capping protein FliD [Pseudoalteromonas prydzensis]|uniref:flagellar filament capping protein FliD n=1 Tax=Pseudoalteromonas prydzensis TaxID=182141 RepID=UPI0007E5159C|nr:flagellar filament capping protein FliD [Pseudoalteromonas prydzensis]MBE0378067.1 flagellar hook-associated protein 2 [Pseudoalteromonas prydzensis ACAM 620]